MPIGHIKYNNKILKKQKTKVNKKILPEFEDVWKKIEPKLCLRHDERGTYSLWVSKVAIKHCYGYMKRICKKLLTDRRIK